MDYYIICIYFIILRAWFVWIFFINVGFIPAMSCFLAWILFLLIVSVFVLISYVCGVQLLLFLPPRTLNYAVEYVICSLHPDTIGTSLLETWIWCAKHLLFSSPHEYVSLNNLLRISYALWFGYGLLFLSSLEQNFIANKSWVSL